MRRRPTDEKLNNLPVKTKQYAFNIPTSPGLQLRVSPGGRKAWSLRYQEPNGNQKRLTVGIFPEMTLDEAEAMAKRPDEIVGPITLEQLVEQYIERWAKPHRSTWREDERVLTGRVLDHFGAKTRASSIRRRDLIVWQDSMVKEGLTAAANRYYGHFRRCLTWAVRKAEYLNADPTAGIEMAVKEQPRERLISDEELRMLWHDLEERSIVAQQAVRLVLATGLRIGEVVSARREHVEPDRWTIPATATKAKRTHLVPVSRFLHGLLKDVTKGELGFGDFLFASPTAATGHLRSQSVGKTIARCFPHLVGELRIHDARRLVGTWMAREGVAPEVISACLGHAPVGVTAIHYIHAEAMLPRQAAALEAWQKYLQQIVKQGPLKKQDIVENASV